MIEGIEGIFSDEEIKLFQPQNGLGICIANSAIFVFGGHYGRYPELMESVPLFLTRLVKQTKNAGVFEGPNDPNSWRES